MSDESEEPEIYDADPCDNGTCDCDCPEAREGRGEAPLTLESMGLTAFRRGEGFNCPKCQSESSALTMTFHEAVTLSMDGTTPCQEWVEKGLLGGAVGEHLCVRCSRCHYGFPMRTADS